MAEKKLLAALPDKLRTVLAKAEQLIGVERLPDDTFHPESGFPVVEAAEPHESQIISTFFQAILDNNQVALQYPARHQAHIYDVLAVPLGLFWDRDRWYLVGRLVEGEAVRTWRADRVVKIRPVHGTAHAPNEFDIRTMLGRGWLRSAIQAWSQQAPVKILLSPAQATRLQQDWYYRFAHFEQANGERVLLTFGEANPAIVLELLRWLGPGAELIEPSAWREQIREELQEMLAYYTHHHR